MRANFHCLNTDLAWRWRYVFAWIGLILYACVAFTLGNGGKLAITAQGLFFLGAFAVILWPVCVAIQSDCDRKGRQRRKAES